MDTNYILVENGPFGIALHKANFVDGLPVDFEYLQVNKLFEATTGIPREKIVGKYMSELFPTLLQGNEDSFIFNYSEALLKGGTREFEVYLQESKKYYKIRFDLFKDDVFVSYILDITAEVKHKELYKMVLLSINDGIIAINLDFTISLINKSAEAMIGATWKDSRKENLSQFVHLFELDGSPYQLEDSINNSSKINPNALTHYQILNNISGKKIPVELSVVPIIHSGIKYGYVINLSFYCLIQMKKK